MKRNCLQGIKKQTHAIILTDSMNLLLKVESGMGCPDWHTAMHSLQLQRLLWIYCPGHAGVSGNERADRLASTADITPGLQLGRAEVLWGLRNFLNTDKPEHHSIDRLKERGVEKGSGWHSTLQGRELSVFNQANFGTVSRATSGRLLRDGAERIWAFPSIMMPSWTETEMSLKFMPRYQISLHWPPFKVTCMWERNSCAQSVLEFSFGWIRTLVCDCSMKLLVSFHVCMTTAQRI